MMGVLPVCSNDGIGDCVAWPPGVGHYIACCVDTLQTYGQTVSESAEYVRQAQAQVSVTLPHVPHISDWIAVMYMPPPAGCSFHRRCPNCSEDGSNFIPGLQRVGISTGHQVSCLRYYAH